MKITDLLSNPGGPVAYFPALRRVTGSVNATVLLCQLIFWHGKQRDPSGWIMKRVAKDGFDLHQDLDDDSLQRETGLTYGELRAARRLLRARGLVSERHERSTHCTFFKLNLVTIQQAWDAEARPERVPSRVSAGAAQGVGRRAAEPPLNGDSIDHTETTTERPPATRNRLDDPGTRMPTSPREALQHPMIQLFQQACDRVPGTRDYAVVIELMRHFHSQHAEGTASFLRPYWLAWSSRKRASDGRPYDAGSLTWLSEWAMNNHIPPSQGGAHASEHAVRSRLPARRALADGPARPSADQERPSTAAERAAARRINLRRRREVQALP